MMIEKDRTPKTKEEEFMAKLIKEFYAIGSNSGFVLGAFTGLIVQMKENNASEEIIKEAENVYELIEAQIRRYDTDLYKMVSDKWGELGRPMIKE